VRVFIDFHRLSSEISVRGELQQLHNLHCSGGEDRICGQVLKNIFHNSGKLASYLQHSGLFNLLLRSIANNFNRRQSFSGDWAKQLPGKVTAVAHKERRDRAEREAVQQVRVSAEQEHGEREHKLL
jgi:hypothetical protein